MGDLVQVKLDEVKPIKGGLEFSIVDNDSKKRLQTKKQKQTKGKR